MTCSESPRGSVDDVCEFCGRSVVGRFSEDDFSYQCDACSDDFRLLNRADKLVMNGWALDVVPTRYNAERDS